MTTIYFVRHAEPNYDNHNDAERELTAKGLRDRIRVTNYLSDKGVDAVLSSPYRRAVDTVKQFSDTVGLPVVLVPDFRERRIDSGWIDDFDEFSRRQWADFSYKLSDGESLGEVQRRNLAALEAVLENHPDQTLAVGSHGTALCTLIHAFDPTFGYEEFAKVKGLMPWIVKFTFQGEKLEKMEFIDIFAE